MELKKVTTIDPIKLHTFMTRHDLSPKAHELDTQTSYIVEEEGTIISLCQLDYVNDADIWLKKLLIVQQEALKLPNVLQTIIQFTYRQSVQTMYVHSKQPVTDLLLSSLSFNLQRADNEQPFQTEQTGNWWYYHFTENSKNPAETVL